MASSRVLCVYLHCKILLLLCILQQVDDTLQTNEDPLDALLAVYKKSREVIAERSKFSNHHRRVRDCQPIIYGNSTFEMYSGANDTVMKYHTSSVHQKLFYKKIATETGYRYVNGHIASVANPFESLSVLEPGGAGGCGKNERATVADSAKQMKCNMAVNAGFFNTHTGSCLGNIVSNGNFVRDAKGIQNANFGILKNGSLVVGYLSEDDVAPGKGGFDFYQLITGVAWILRNGSLYIDESIKAECQNTEETGTLKTFAQVLSARTAVGHDKNGRVIIVQVEGKTHQRGINLYDFGKLLQSYGLVNAINLDGGGSATFVVNGTLVNYPADVCHGFLCARKVSTILCVHGKICDPPDCNGHGDCSTVGQCVCHAPWSGPSCSQQEFKETARDAFQLCNMSLSGNHSRLRGNVTTKEMIKRFLIKNYAWLDALLVISVLVNFILLFVTFCGRSSCRVVVAGRMAKSSNNREDEMNLLSSSNYNDDEI